MVVLTYLYFHSIICKNRQMNKENVLNKTVSHTAAIFPILMALKKFEEKGIYFTERTTVQKDIMSLLREADQVKYSENEIKSFVADNAPELNKILRDNGFDIQLDEKAPFDLGVVTIMDLVAKWIAKANSAIVNYEGTEYPAALIKHGASIVNNDYGERTLIIRTTTGLCVFIQIADEEKSGLDLFCHIFEQARKMTHSETPCDAIIPLVDLNEQPDISWLIGMSCESPRFTINQALQQNRLKITLDGIHAESAVALGAARGIGLERPRFVVDRPFNIWLAYGNPELQYFPLFCAYVAPDTWKESK